MTGMASSTYPLGDLEPTVVNGKIGLDAVLKEPEEEENERTSRRLDLSAVVNRYPTRAVSHAATSASRARRSAHFAVVR